MSAAHDRSARFGALFEVWSCHALNWIGCTAYYVASKEKLPAVINALIAAVRAGELDDLFSQAAKTGAVGKESLTARDVRVGSDSE